MKAELARPTVSKIEAIERQLVAAVFLLLKDFSPEAVHTLVAASRGLLYGLHKSRPNEILRLWDTRILDRVVPGSFKEWRSFQNKVANFLKHADRDADQSMKGVDIAGLNELELVLCILAFWQVKKDLPQKLLIGLLYCHAKGTPLIDLRSIFLKANLPVDNFDSFCRMNERDRKQISLDTFEILQAKGVQ